MALPGLGIALSPFVIGVLAGMAGGVGSRGDYRRN